MNIFKQPYEFLRTLKIKLSVNLLNRLKLSTLDFSQERYKITGSFTISFVPSLLPALMLQSGKISRSDRRPICPPQPQRRLPSPSQVSTRLPPPAPSAPPALRLALRELDPLFPGAVDVTASSMRLPRKIHQTVNGRRNGCIFPESPSPPFRTIQNAQLTESPLQVCTHLINVGYRPCLKRLDCRRQHLRRQAFGTCRNLPQEAVDALAESVLKTVEAAEERVGIDRLIASLPPGRASAPATYRPARNGRLYPRLRSAPSDARARYHSCRSARRPRRCGSGS